MLCEVECGSDYGDVELVFLEDGADVLFCFWAAFDAEDDAGEVFAQAGIDGGAVRFVPEVTVGDMDTVFAFCSPVRAFF